MKFPTLISFLFASTFVVASCGGSSDSQPQPDEIVWRKGEPVVVVHHGPVPKKLIVKDLRTGTGAVLKKGSLGTFKYKSFDYRTGQRYEDWWDEPFRTSFGEGESLAAWETGLKGMRVGGRRVLIVPPAQAYTHVPVVYVLELVSVGSPKPKLHYPSRPPGHVVVRVLKQGSGPSAKLGDQLTARYLGGNPKTKLVQDFWSAENPYRFEFGHNPLAKSWDIALKGIKLGERREFIVPSRLAYGEGMMVYVLELVEIEKPKSGRER